MNKDRVKGKMKDVVGRAKRQVGEWTGDEEKQVEGTGQQVEGKIQNAWGKLKDKTKQVGHESSERQKGRNTDREIRDIDEDAA
jgi:uncharacterized protein YjbJ (UPF0337 family)